MAYESRFISLKPIIESVYRDSGIEEINFETALEDAGELIGLLGVPYTYVDKNTNGTDAPLLQVIDYRAYLPEDVAYILALRKITLDGNNRIKTSEEMIEDPSMFFYDKKEILPAPNYVYPVSDHPLIDLTGNSFRTTNTDATFTVNTPVRFSGTIFGGISLNTTYYIKTVVNAYEFTVSEMIGGPTKPLTAATGAMAVTNQDTSTSLVVIETTDEGDDIVVADGVVTGVSLPIYGQAPHGYKINNNVIFTSFENGYINLAYKAYPTDDDGFLMVPDDEKLRAAIKYHLIYKIDFRRWRANPASPGMKALLNDSEQRRDFYVGAARNKAHIPTYDKMESIKNRWIGLIPRINEHMNGFTSLNKREKRKY